MGTEINLTVGGISVDWAESDRDVDHGPLFQESDRQHVSSDPADAIGEDERHDTDKAFRRSCTKSAERQIPEVHQLNGPEQVG